jgi:23S rRNA pseudouridine2605 synthase
VPPSKKKPASRHATKTEARAGEREALRLHVVLARAGIASRRAAEELIRRGSVAVNGHVIRELGTRADPRVDRITVDGKPLRLQKALHYVAFNKPVGMVTTLTDPEGRPCVGDVIASLKLPLHPVGRLDYHTSGLLLLTNDGDLTARLTHARYHVPKTYAVKLDRPPTPEQLAKLRTGVEIEKGLAARARVRPTRTARGKGWMTVTIYEGRKRQVRRMLEEVGLRVDKLRRVGIGPLSLGSLPTGATRKLLTEEVVSLRRAAGLE